MKKKIFALLLALLMLLPFVVACGGGNDDPGEELPPEEQPPEEQPNYEFKNDDEDKSLPVGSVNSRDEVEKVEADRSKLYDGETFKILATIWGESAEPGAPWSQAELTIKPSDADNDKVMDGGFGRTINTSLIERENLIKEVYGISLEWINAKNSKISNILATNLNNPAGEKYHLAMPRMLESQALVENQLLVNIANSPNINLDKPYFNQVAREAYSVGGNTYFVAGDFSFLDEHTSSLVFYNLSLGEKVGNLYRKVKNGEWTIEEMINAANKVGANDGDETPGEWGDDDTYGFGTSGLAKFFQSSGIQQVTVQQTVPSDPTTRQYIISLNDNRVSELVDKLITINKATWARSEWKGGYGAMGDAFDQNRLLFYNEVVQKFDYFGKDVKPDLKLGVLPMPKLNVDQDTYYTQCSYQAVLACVPKTTPSKNRSTYLLDILSWTGQEYVMGYTFETNDDGDTVRVFNGKGYYGYLAPKVDDYRDEGDSMDILINDIMGNLIFDVGYMNNWNGLLTSVQTDSYIDGENKFTSSYEAAIDDANTIVTKWNESWSK